MRSTLALFAAATVSVFAQNSDKCAQLAQFKSPGLTLEITRAEHLAAGPAPGGRAGAPAGPVLPAHCRVNGIIDRRTGPDGKQYGIKFAIALPDTWSAQYLQQGGGGLNGTVAEPTGAHLPAPSPPSREALPSRQQTPATSAAAADSMAPS